MIYYKYFSELKYRTSLLVLTWLSSIIVCYVYRKTLLFLMVNLTEPQNLTNVNRHLIFTDVTELFTTYINLALFVASQTVAIFGIYQSLLFLTPSFYSFEYKNAMFLAKWFFVVWWFSMGFLHKILLPLSWNFFINFNKSDGNAFDLFFEAKVDQYLDYYMNLYYACLLSSVVIVTLTVLINFLNNNLKTIRNSRRIYYCFFILLATLVTPPDISSQLFLSSCFCGFYEMFVFTGILKSN